MTESVSIRPQMNERYELLAPIAEGGLGTVFKARDRQLGREVALKRIRADKAGDYGSAVESLIREAQQQSLLQHPNIVTVHDAGVDDDGGFIVMELVKGEALEDIARLRYKSYLQNSLVMQNESKQIIDRYDGDENAYIFGVYLDEALVATIRPP